MENQKEIISTALHEPGVYIYRDKRKTVLYVGKAKDLKKRIGQYFRNTLRDPKTIRMVSQIQSIETVPTQNEFDALLLEAKLIRSYNPKYNIISKDDKSPLYVCISSEEELPYVTFVRKHVIENIPERVYFGPFQSTNMARMLLLHIRHIIPFCTQKKRNGTPCFYSHIGLCNPCPSYISGIRDIHEKQNKANIYRKNIQRIVGILSGKSIQILKDLDNEMREFSRLELFEDAQKTKQYGDNLRALLQKHYDPMVYLSDGLTPQDISKEETTDLLQVLQPYFPSLHDIHTIECMDISHLRGSYATGSSIVFTDGKPCKKLYRRFRIRTDAKSDDLLAMKELFKRRISHNGWKYPDLFIVDGGKGQLGTAMQVLHERDISMPVIGLAKQYEHIIVPKTSGLSVLQLPYSRKAISLLSRIRDESHRFAVTYHRLLRKKAFLQQE